MTMELKTIDTKKVAKQIIDAIKNGINAEKKKDYLNTYEVEIEYYNTRCGTLEGYTINVGKFKTDIINKSQFRSLANEIVVQLKELSKVKGWNNLSWDIDEVVFSRSLYYTDKIDMPSVVRLLANPCKEFKSLANYVEKYCGKKIGMTDIYSVGIGGKRGRIYGEEGCRYYLAHKPKTCSALLEELRKTRGSKDIVTTSDFKRIDDIDKWELECSIRNEVEFSGCRYNQCDVTIKTPSGKVKKVVRIGV